MSVVYLKRKAGGKAIYEYSKEMFNRTKNYLLRDHRLATLEEIKEAGYEVEEVKEVEDNPKPPKTSKKKKENNSPKED